MNVHLYTYKNVKPYAYIYIYIFIYLNSYIQYVYRTYVTSRTSKSSTSQSTWNSSNFQKGPGPWARPSHGDLMSDIFTGLLWLIWVQQLNINHMKDLYFYLDISLISLFWLYYELKVQTLRLVSSWLVCIYFEPMYHSKSPNGGSCSPVGSTFEVKSWPNYWGVSTDCITDACWIVYQAFQLSAITSWEKSEKRFLRTLLKKRVDTCWPNSCRPWTPNKIFHVITSQLGSGLSTVELAGYWVYHVPQWVFQHFPAS